MRYYEQLLESFNRLKKRTFKLTILEQGQGEVAPGDAGEAVKILQNLDFGPEGTGPVVYQNKTPNTDTPQIEITRSDPDPRNASLFNYKVGGRSVSINNGVISGDRLKSVVTMLVGGEEGGTQVGTQTAPGQTAPPGTGAPGGVPVVDPYMGMTPAGITAENSGFKDKELVKRRT